MRSTVSISVALAVCIGVGAVMYRMMHTGDTAAECYDNVLITGYYVPELESYDAIKTETVEVLGEHRTYNASFLQMVRVKEGGVARTGEVLIYENGQWRVRVEPLTEAEKTWFPREEDFVATRKIATIEDGAVREYPKAFVDEAGLQGSGKIAEHAYVGWPSDCPTTDGLIAYLSPQCDSQWHIRDQPLDASGKPAELGLVATDKKYFDAAHPWHVTITPAPAGFERNTFEARDLGPAIVEKHIDVFAGWGFEGLTRALSLTGETYTVCFRKTF